MFTTLLAILLILSSTITALPVKFSSNRPNSVQQTVLYTQNTKLYDIGQEENWFMSQEYDLFSTITDYYENMIDSTLNSESEDLLINLVYLPQEIKTQVLIKQAKLIGIVSLSDKQLIKMPSIIGKHVQEMNAQVYQSIENIITLYWHTIWDPRLLSKKDQGQEQEEHIMSFLSAFNGIVAKKLMEKIDEYDLIQEIKADLLDLKSFESKQFQHEQEVAELTWFDWLVICCKSFFLTTTTDKTPTTVTTKNKYFDLETDFLREYLSDMRTGLLMELHIQFMDFFTRIQTDIVDQLSIYYDQELF